MLTYHRGVTKRLRSWLAWLLAASLLPLMFLVQNVPANAVSSNPTPDCSAGSTCTITFAYSGDYYAWTLPNGITSIDVSLSGAQGGSGSSPGGKGGVVAGTLSVSPGATIYVYVGGQNGWNGGGSGGTGGPVSYNSSSGGGASDIRIGGTALTDRKVVAGGGGGAGRGNCSTQQGGGGGYPGGLGGVGGTVNSGNNGGTNGGGVNGTYYGGTSCTWSTYGGGGGGQNGGGGAGGYGTSTGGSSGNCGSANSNPGIGGSTGVTSGCFGVGGNGGTMTNGGGGGGGGGWYGGGPGGGNWGSGGGGGSSYLGELTNSSYANANRSGNGTASITYLNVPTVSSFNSAQSTPTNSLSSFTYSLTFSETVNTVAAADFSNGGTATGCSFTPSASSGKSVTLTISGCSEGTLTPRVNQNSVFGTVTNLNGPPDTSSATTTIVIDRTAPTVSRVDSPTAGTYSPTGAPRGPNMDFSVRMSESVTVSTGVGIPRLTLTVGSSTQYASYLSQSDSTTLTFRYTIDSSLTQVDTNGVTMTSSLDLNGGSISDYAGNALSNTTITPPTLTSVLVAQKASAPTITLITPGDTRLTVAFTAGADNGSPITNYKYSLNGAASIAFSPVDTTTPVVITGLTNGTGYSVRLIPVTAVGDGDTSTAVTETPTAVVVSAGSNISTSYGRIETSTAFTASGGTSPYSFSLSPTVSGISINSSTGRVTTSSTLAVGSYSSNVVATDASSRTGRTAITVTVTKATPTFSAWSNVTKTFGNSPYSIDSPTVTGSLAGTFTYTSSNSSVISISGSTATVAGAGSATITALFTPTDSSNYETATTTNTVTVNKASQTITFGALSNRTLGTGTFLLSASDTSSSGLALAYSSATLATCTLSGSDSRTVTLVSAGTCTINANQAGNGNYDSATTVTRSFTISSALSITTPSGASLSATYNSAFTLTLSSSGGSGGNVFTLATGTLPSGVLLNSSSGVISGTPSTAGNFAIIITVTDSNSATASTSSFTIAVAQLNPTVSLALAGGVSSTPIGVSINITATVSQDGTLTFKSGGSTLSGCSSVSSSSGSATCSWTPGALGSASLTADLVPTDSTNYANVTSSALNVTVVSGSTTIEISFSSSISKGKTITITASTTNIAGKVTFQVNRRNIKGCVNRNVSAGSASCSWKVALHGNQTVAATFNPTNNAYNSSSTSQSVVALRRISR